MKHRKTALLASLAALTVFASVGAGSASAEVIPCKNNEEPCSKSPVTNFTASLATGTSAVVDGSAFSFDLSCGTSKLDTERISPETKESSSVWGSAFSLGSCKAPEQVYDCSGSKMLNSPFEAELINSKEGTDGIFISNFGNGAPVVKWQCIWNKMVTITCEAEAPFPFFEFSGGEPAHLKLNAVFYNISKTLCPETFTVKATYEVTEPSSLYMSHN